MDTPTVLVVDDERAARFALRRALEKGFTVAEAETGEQAIAAIERERPALVLLDLNMPGMGGLDALVKIRERPDAPPVIVLTAHGSERIAVDAMKRGAADYLPKPYDVDELRLVARRAIEHRELERENQRLKTALRAGAGLGQLLGQSAAMGRVLDVIRRVAPLDATVLIEGESGTGKELVARELHRLSPRAARPFVAVNCAALPEGLVESELFGHERGAFTGAVSVRRGRFEMANGGTLFLDEIGEAPAPLQAKLLRVLETRRFERVGGAELHEANIRLVAATNRDLKAEVAGGKFREDLYYRLKVVDIPLPALRARRGDVALLARHFAEVAATKYGLAPRLPSAAALARLEAYRWPGNVRELAHAIEKAAILSIGSAIEPESLPAEIAAMSDDPLPGCAAAETNPPPLHGGGADMRQAQAEEPVKEPPGEGRATTASDGPVPERAPVPAAPPALDGDASGALESLADAEVGTPFAEAKRRAMIRFETELITRELVRSRGNISKTARALGVHRQSLQHKLRELGVDVERFRDREGAEGE